MQQRAMALMGKKMSAATALEGKISTEGLVAMAGEDNAQMALARSLSQKIEDAQRTWSKVTESRRMLVEPEPILLPIRQVETLSVPAQMIMDTVSECGMEDVATIPMLSRDEIAVMLLRLQESGFSLDF